MHPCRFNLSVFHQFAVEGIGAAGGQGVAPAAGRGYTAPDRQPQ